MSTSMKHSYELLKSVNISVEMLKCNIQFHLILQGFTLE